MKIAAETVIWGDRIEDMPYTLDVIASAGCAGVEFSQTPLQLGDPGVLKNLLAERGLTLVGLSGGTLRDRVEYCGQLLRPEYLYIEDWDDDNCQAAMRQGFTLALHPHVSKTVHRLAQAEDLLRKHETLKFLPDNFHLEISGESAADVASAVVGLRDRLAAIHLKDWTPIYGRSSHRYARGFRNLGEGEQNFDPLFVRLHQINYKGWLVFEQGSSESTPEGVVKAAVTWLNERGAVPVVRPSMRRSPPPPRPPKLTPARNYSPEEERDFQKKLLDAATNSATSYYPQLTEAIGCLLRAELVLLCGCSPTADVMDILGSYPGSIKLPKKFMKYRNSLSNVAVERQTPTRFDLKERQPGLQYGFPNASFGYREIEGKMRLEKLISVPVLNPGNPHQARFVLNVFPKLGSAVPDLKDLERLGNLIAQAAESALDERCALAAAKASVAAGKCQQSNAFLEALVPLIKESLLCDALSILLVSETGQRLEEVAGKGIPWRVDRPQRLYTKEDKDELVVRVWQDREAIISPNAHGNGYVIEKFLDEKYNINPSCLCAPMVDVQNNVIGVVLCRQKRSDQNLATMFSEDDVTVLDAICRSAIPHLQVLLSKQRRAKALRRLTHELHTPLNVIEGAVDRMTTELDRRKHTSASIFSLDYLGDIKGWVSLMRFLLGNADWFRPGTQKIILERRLPSELYADVFMPAINQIGPLLKYRDFDPAKIFVENFKAVPPLWVDKRFMTQVVFNLISNAIKYAYDDPNEFRVEVTAEAMNNHYVIYFRDWGPGIAPEIAETIFLEGVRADEAEQRDVKGDGLGLWVARNAVAAHGGTITLTGYHRPTQFTISLPNSLRFKPRKE